MSKKMIKVKIQFIPLFEKCYQNPPKSPFVKGGLFRGVFFVKGEH